MNDETKTKSSRYAALAAKIRDQIIQGELTPGDRLPSIREASQTESLSPGTIKQAYKLLASEGYVSMIQGCGTIVLDRTLDPDGPTDLNLIPVSKQAQAEKAIDALFAELNGLGFTLAEIRIFFDLKLRQILDGMTHLTIGVIDCNPEARHMMAEEIASFHDSDIFEYGLETILSFPERLPDNLSLIFTTTTHKESLDFALEDRVKIHPIVLSPTPDTISSIAKLNPDDKIGLIALSHEFIGIMLKALHKYSDVEVKPNVDHFGASTGLKLGDSKSDRKYDAIILPANYDRFSSKTEQEQIAAFEAEGGRVIRFEYKMDHGSLLIVEDLINAAEQQLQDEAIR